MLGRRDQLCPVWVSHRRRTDPSFLGLSMGFSDSYISVVSEGGVIHEAELYHPLFPCIQLKGVECLIHVEVGVGFCNYDCTIRVVHRIVHTLVWQTGSWCGDALSERISHRFVVWSMSRLCGLSLDSCSIGLGCVVVQKFL